MRRLMIASVGTFLVLVFASYGYPHVEEGLAAAHVAASEDIELSFGIQHEVSFEVRDNYDLDNGLTDGCPRVATTGNDCSGARTNTDGFVEQESRLVVQGSQGDIWRARVIFQTEEDWETERFATGLIEAWADIKLFDTPVHVRVGAWQDHLDPFRMVYATEGDQGVIAYAHHGTLAWRLWWVKVTETADLDNEEEGGGPASGGRDGDQDYYMARVDLDFGTFQVSPAVGFLRNRQTIDDARFATGTPSQDSFASCHNFRRANAGGGFDEAGSEGECEANVEGVTVDETVIYPGLIAQGTFGPVSFVGQVFGAFGEIGDASAVDAQREQDVSALLVAADVGVKLGAWLPHVGIIFLSGDDNPHDDDAEAWAGIQPFGEQAFLFGERGIVFDDNFSTLNIANESLEATNSETVGARQYFTQPGMIAVAVGLKGRPTKKIKTDLNVIYFQWDMEKAWEFVDGMVTTVNCIPNKTQSQQGVCSNNNFTSAVADGSGLVSTVDDEMGWEINGAVTYEYNEHVLLIVSAAVFFPGDGAEVVAQCANAADDGGNHGWLLEGDARDGCGDPANNGGIEISTVRGIARADDEAFNVETELVVTF